ncbi:MAG TPA: class I SAM-dependent methyltransferase [Gemmata sp.]
MPGRRIEDVFDQKCASGYDQRWAKLAPLRDALHLLVAAVLSDVRPDARVLCVGAGTGSELLDLAQRHPGWSFTAVEPSAPMLDVCRRKAEACGVADRCAFHVGYLDSLPVGEEFDAATALLVSQFILDRSARSDFFRGIGARLRPGGWFVCSDLAGETTSGAYQRLLDVWWRVMRAMDAPPEGLDRMRSAYERDVAVLPPGEVAALVESGGFEPPVPFYQTGLVHAWFTRRAAGG